MQFVNQYYRLMRFVQRLFLQTGVYQIRKYNSVGDFTWRLRGTWRLKFPDLDVQLLIPAAALARGRDIDHAVKAGKVPSVEQALTAFLLLSGCSIAVEYLIHSRLFPEDSINSRSIND